MRPVHYSLFSIILKGYQAPYNLVTLFLQPYADGRVVCKNVLNASRALLVFQCAILKRVLGPVECVSLASDGGVG